MLTKGAGIPKQALLDQTLVVGETDKDLRFYLTALVESMGGRPITPTKDDNWTVVPANLYKAGAVNSRPLLFPDKK